VLSPFLIVGVGGSGGKTIRAFKHLMSMRLREAGWTHGWPDAWQLLHIDSPVLQDGEEFSYPLLSDAEYLGLVPAGTNYQVVYNAFEQKVPGENRMSVNRPLPDPQEVTVPVTIGAGQYRAIGRTLAISRLSAIQKKVEFCFGRMKDAGAQGTLARLGEEVFGVDSQGANPRIKVFVISSLAGGSGSGAYLDVVEAIKSAGKSSNVSETKDSYGILYAPDVFDTIEGRRGVAPNALAAMAEAMSGQWCGANDAGAQLTADTVALYRSQGVLPPLELAEYSLGPRYTFLIGRSNSAVTFASADQVFASTATSLITWTTDKNVTATFGAYMEGNWHAQAASVPDKTRLKLSNQAPPFSSFGYGRVTLGRDRFAQYCEELLARLAVESLVNQYEADHPAQDVTKHVWLETKADARWSSFRDDSGFNEEDDLVANVRRDDVIDALRPEREIASLTNEFKELIRHDVIQGLDKNGGLSSSDWQERIERGYRDYSKTYLQKIRNFRLEKTARWVEVAVPNFQDLVARYCVSDGIDVTIELVKRLESSLVDPKGAIEQLRDQSNAAQTQVGSYSSYIANAFQDVVRQGSIRPEHDSVITALNTIGQILGVAAESELRLSAANILKDFADNYLQPLRMSLTDARTALESQINVNKALNGLPNPFLTWPKLGQPVSDKYRPGTNERVILSADTFEREFMTLVQKSIGESRDAVKAATLQSACGSHVLSDLGPSSWSLLSIDGTNNWIPQSSDFNNSQGLSGQAAKFKFKLEFSDYVNDARLWLERPGQSFASYLSQDLASYLTDPSIGDGELTSRRASFLQELDAAVSVSAPFIAIHDALLTDVHQASTRDKTVAISAIPFAFTDPISEGIIKILRKYGAYDESAGKDWFGATNSTTKYIDIFSLLKNPYEPVVFTSIMNPIATQWASVNADPEQRESFWKWRRARTLIEALPASPKVVNHMIRGWFVAKTLSQLDVAVDSNLGPKLAIFAGPIDGFVGFPYPLLSHGLVRTDDYLGALLESLTIALAQCNGVGTLEPLRAYQRLIELGGDSRDLSLRMKDWIQEAKVEDRAPIPNATRAGSKEQTAAERRKQVVTYLTQELDYFNRMIEGLDGYANVRTYPVIWEIAPQVRQVLTELLNLVEKVSDVGNSGI